IVDSRDNENLILSTRNVQTTKVVNSFALNIYDLLYHEQLIVSEAAIKELEQLLSPKKETAGEPVVAAAEVKEVAKPKRAKQPAAKTTKSKAKGKEAAE